MGGAVNQKIALVTGASRRLGLAIARALAQKGFAVALHASARSTEEARIACADICAAGGRACVLSADLADLVAVAGLMARAREALGPVTLLVNNASLFEADSAGAFDPALFDQHMAVNLRAPLQLASDFAAGLPEGRDGLIVNLLDQRVWRLNPHFFSYTLSKSALWTATRTMAQAFAPRIRVNGIGPGPTLANHMQQTEDFLREASAIALGRAIDPQEIAAAVLFLVEARSVTGQMIAVDGGQHLAWKTPDVEA
jgi:NAD(P)-dependent dehydrogenase (short-subunit alcohol dehydrogenase family)